MMCRWTTRGAARMEMPGAKPRHEHFADRPVYDHGIRAWLRISSTTGSASGGRADARRSALV